MKPSNASKEVARETFREAQKDISVHIKAHDEKIHAAVRALLNPYLEKMVQASNAGDFVERLFAAMALFYPGWGLRVDDAWEDDLLLLHVRLHSI